MNIMYDRRVIRGNTYAAQVLPMLSPLEEPPVKRPSKRRLHKTPFRTITTPEPVQGRRHRDVQTDTYLEELTDKVPEAAAQTQTDAFLDRPLTPLYVPQKSGVDAETQIEEGDLFDFDLEVEPILEVLVGKTLEQSLMEVMEEEELAEMRAHQDHFEAVRNAELVATQRMEAAEQRKVAEKERRMKQEKARLLHMQTVKEKVAAQQFSRGYLQGLMSSVFEDLRHAGVFYDPVQKEVELQLMPWLKAAMTTELQKTKKAHMATRALIESAVQAYEAVRARADDKRAVEMEAERRREEAEAASRAAAAEEAHAQQVESDARLFRLLSTGGHIPEEELQEAAAELAARGGGAAAGSQEGDAALMALLRERGAVPQEVLDEVLAAAAAAAAPMG